MRGGGGTVTLAILLLTAACTAGVTANGNGNGNGTGAVGVSGTGGGGPGTGGGGPGTGGGTGNPGTGGQAPAFTLECTKPNAGSPTLRLLTRNELESSLNDVFPGIKGMWSSSLPANQLSAFGFDNDSGAMVGQQLAGALVDTALSVASAVTGSALPNLLPCAAAADHACADQFVTKYGRRLFRRPLTAAEHDRYLAFFDASKAKSDFKTALKWTTVGLIQSPNAVYRSEIGTDAGNGTRKLTPYEIATALAYTFTGSTPSDALLAQADSGNMGDLLAQAKMLASTDAGKQVLQRFFEGYLGYSGVASVQHPNIAAFAGISADMARETRAFIDDVIFQHGGGMKQLLTATTTNPSQALATYYGFPAPASNYASVARPAGRGVGLLAQGSFLASHASPTSSSPTRRGLFPYLQLLCQKKLSPPPNVPQISTPQPGQKTTRQRYEDVHAKMGAACGFCHQKFDPIGFAFEHFDEGGRYRQDEGGLPIDSSGAITKDDGTTLFTFSGQEELATNLANQPVVHQCLAAYLATYAFGSNEACLGSSKVPDLQSGAMGIAEAFAQLAAEPHFTTRNAQ